MRLNIVVPFLLTLVALLHACKEDGGPPPPDGPDTTTHNWSFRVDTLGEFGSSFKDVALLSDGTALAVGSVFGVDTSGPFGQLPVGAMHWNGTAWAPRRIVASFSGNTTNVAPIRGIVAFTPGDIWFAAGSVVQSNGTSYIGYPLRGTILTGNETVEKLWGTSRMMIYGVGNEGTIVRWDGTSWTKLDSHTTVDLLDVWGNPDGSVVWACGYRSNYSESVLLQYSASQWRTIWKTPPPSSTQPYTGLLQSLWIPPNSDTAIVVGGEGVYRQPLHGNSTARKENVMLGSFPTCIRGRAANDFFVAGYDGMLWHFNGQTWHRYTELANTSHVFYSIAMTGQTVIAVGADYGAGIQRGLVLTGHKQ